MNDTHPTTGPLFFRNGHLLALAIVLLGLAGLSALANLPRIEDPRIVTRNAVVLTALPGASAERVESLVTEKLENRLRELDEVTEIRSTSRSGLSVINVELDALIDADTNEEAFAKVRDALEDARSELPPDASRPRFDDKRGAVAFTLITALSWEAGGDVPLGLLGRLADDLADDLRNVPGTEQVRVYGAPDEQITVTADPERLAAQGLTAGQLAGIVAAGDPKTAAGALRTGGQDLFIEVAGELDSVARIRELTVARGSNGRAIRVGDLATVERGWREPLDEIALYDGRQVVFVAASIVPSVRVDQWIAGARQRVDAFDATLDEGVRLATVFDQTTYTADRLAGLSGNLMAGAAVVVAVVLLGMGLRAAIIVGAALPLSMFTAVFGFTFFGQQIHQMTIFGLIIALGLLIDNAIVVTDEIQKRLTRGDERGAAVSGAIGHLFAPLLASTLTTILGFMPIFLLPGNIGDFIGPIAISVVLALAASFAISMTVIAALAGRYLAPCRNDHRWWRKGLELPRLAGASHRLLSALLRRPVAAIGGALALPVLGFVLAGTLGLQFFPPAERDQFEIEVWLPNDAAIDRTRAVASRIEAVVRGLDDVEQVSWRIGGSHPTVYYNRIMREDGNRAYAHALVKTTGVEAANALVRELEDSLPAQFPEAQVVVSLFGQGPPIDAPVVFRLVGPSADVLERLGDDVRRIMHLNPDITYSRATLTGRAKLSVRADQTEAGLSGLSLDELTRQFGGNLEGVSGGSVLEGLEELPVRVRYGQDYRGSLSEIGAMQLVTDAGPMPADSLGDIALLPERASITRRDGERINDVYGYTTRDALPIEVAADIQARLDSGGLDLPPGYRLEQAGNSAEQSEAVGLLMTYLPVLVTMMIASLVLSFRSVALAAVVGIVAAASAGLGMLSLWLGGFNLGFNPLLGSAGLIGVAINGTIVVLAALRADPRARTGDIDAVVRTTLGASRHILSTTATTIGGFAPLLLFAGGEFWPPLAIVIAGGVGFSVILSLVFTPAVFRLLTPVLTRRSRSAPAAVDAPAVA